PPSFSEIIIQNTIYTQLSVPDCVSIGSAGFPQLPQRSIQILLPYQQQVKHISVESVITKDFSEQISQTQIIPMQQSIPLNDQSNHRFIKNQSMYNSQKKYPSSMYDIHSVDYLAGYPILTIRLHPFIYNPVDETLIQITQMNIELTFTHSLEMHANSFYRGKTEDRQRISQLVINPEMIDSYPLDGEEQSDDNDAVLNGSETNLTSLGDSYTDGLCNTSDSFDYVIVTTADLSDTTEYTYNWTDLLNHRKQQDGLTGTIVTIEEIDECSDYYNETEIFNDSAAHLREFCKDAYLDWNTDYMLLAGDWSETDSDQQKIPARFLTDAEENETGYNTMPSDLYFSNLDGDWYDENNALWGGGRYGENDKLSELSVGRIPVWNLEMVSNAVEKIIWYDECDDESFLRSAGFLGGYLGWTTTSKQYMEEIRVGDGSFSEYEGFEEWNDDYPDYELDTTARYYEADYATESDAVNAWKNAINNNEMSLVNHLDHGSYDQTLSLGYGSSLSNTHFFLGISQACLSGRYTAGRSGAESFICESNTKGSFALILNTGYGYGSSTSTNGASQLLHKIWWDYYFENQTTNFDNWRLGLAMQYTKDMFSSMIDSSSHSYCYVWYSWNLFGDPAQQLQIKPEENNPPVISSPIPSPDSDNVSKNITSLSIQMNDADEDLLNWSIETSPDIGSNSGMNEQAGTKSCEIDGLSFDTSYTWYVNVSDGKTEICHLFSFNVESGSMNHAPQLSYPNPLNESINIDVHLSEVSIQINDLESNIFSYTIQGTHVQGITNDNQSNGTKTTTCITPLPFATQIMWYVNASDTMNATYEWFTFTTRDKYIPQSPSDLTSYAVNRSCIHLEWTVDDQTDKTRVERNLFPEWELGSGVLVYNGTDQKIIDNNLSSKETYYYQAWSYNETDNVYSLNSTSGQQTTHLNHPPEITSVTPLNNSENLSVEFTYLANLSDLDADQLQWMITCSHGECNSSKAKNTTASLDLNNLEKNTTYRVWINVTDGYDWTRSWYQFSTHQIHIPPKVTGFSANIVNSTQSQISWDKPAYNPVLLEYHQQPEWDVGNGIMLYNGTEKNTITHNGLTRNSTYHYQLWQYNALDQTYSEPVSTQITTPSNVNPILTGETPQNQSIPSSLPSSWSVMITDSDEDLLN
ncbi:MAG: hypothetical protein KGY50_03500, partial [Candidatus Thermoplasmatota archaeon]|nr:hypothetical protein [Candidatus Thermoplasmatota archaeon]